MIRYYTKGQIKGQLRICNKSQSSNKMNQIKDIKTLLNQIKQFPQFHDMIDDLNSEINSQKKIIDGLNLVFSNNCLSIFNKDLPKEIITALEEIQKAGELQTSIFQNMLSTISIIPNSFNILNNLYKEMSQDWISIYNSQEVASKSEANMKKAAENSKKYEGHETFESEKARAAREEAERTKNQYDIDYENAERIKTEKHRHLVQLRQEFVESLAISLKSMAQVREEASKDLAKVSTTLQNSLLFLDQSSPPVFRDLEERLRQLENETID